MVPQPVTTPSPGIRWFGHAEIVRAMLDEHVPFLERAFVEEKVNALARRQLALGVLGVDAPLAPAQTCFRALLFQRLDQILHASPRVVVTVLLRADRGATRPKASMAKPPGPSFRPLSG